MPPPTYRMMMTRGPDDARARIFRLCLLICVVTALSGPGAALSGPGAASSPPSTAALSPNPSADTGSPTQIGDLLAQDQPVPDATVTRIHLAANGTATWRLTFRTRLSTSTAVSEYEQFQAAFEQNTTRYVDPFETRMRGVVTGVNATTDRPMRADGFDASTSIQEVPRRWGVVTFRFRWVNFATVEDDRVIVGDAFGSGFYIAADDTLVITPPEGYTIETVDPQPSSTTANSVEWTGREDFAANRPRVVALTTTAGADSDESSLSTPTGDSRPTLLVGVLVLGVAAVYALVRRRRELSGEPSTAEQAADSADHAAGEAVGETAAGEAADAETAAGETAGETADSATHAAGPTAGPTADPAADQTDDTPPTDQPLRTDTDRVIHALEANGGRMKQSALGETLEWSKSKTSRVLSEMEADGTIEKLRIGRENVIDLV